jgi:hypothetical protein
MRRVALGLAVLAVLVGAGEVAGRTASSTAQGASPAPSIESPFSGTWVANIAKSQRHPNHLFQSATLRFVVMGDTVTITHGGVNAGGQEESGTIVLQADGKEHAASEQTPGIVVVTRWAGPRVLEVVAKNAGATVGHQSFQVSVDGKTLTTNVWGTDASGKRFEQVIVFDRKVEAK